MNIPSVILEALKACPTPDNRWRYAYELIVGAGASLLSAHPHYVGTTHYHHKKRYGDRLEILPELLLKAHRKATNKRKPINLYIHGLEDWTAGYFFNSGLFRIACGYDYTIATIGNTGRYDVANFTKICGSLKQRSPSPEIDKLLDIVKSLQSYGRKKLDSEVDRLVNALVDQNIFNQQIRVATIYTHLESHHDDFLKAALLFVWCDYNWFKHRPIGYSGEGHPRERPPVQYALALRAYRALCDLYSWCRTLNLAPST